MWGRGEGGSEGAIEEGEGEARGRGRGTPEGAAGAQVLVNPAVLTNPTPSSPDPRAFWESLFYPLPFLRVFQQRGSLCFRVCRSLTSLSQGVPCAYVMSSHRPQWQECDLSAVLQSQAHCSPS